MARDTAHDVARFDERGAQLASGLVEGRRPAAPVTVTTPTAALTELPENPFR